MNYRISPLKQIRKQCRECHSGSTKSVRFCHSVDCPLWFLRFGKFPNTLIRHFEEEFIQLFNRENFLKKGKFSPDLDISQYRLKK